MTFAAKPPAPDRTDFRFWISDRIRFADLDPLGHCNNAAISAYFESARISLMARCGITVPPSRLAYPIVRQLIEFRAELLYDEAIEIGTRLEAIGRTSITLSHAIFARRLAATAVIKGVVIDTATRRPIDVPAEMRRALIEVAGLEG